VTKFKPGFGGRLAPQFFFLGVLLSVLPVRAARVVSLNLCTDELLVLLSPESVAALSPLARDPSLSVVASQAASLPWVRPDAEAVLSLHPDLVLAGEYGAQAVLAVLRARGLRVVQVPEAADFASVATEVRQVAAVLGVPAKGASLIARMWARLGAVPRHHGDMAMLWEARGFSAGPGSFGDAVLHEAGLGDAGTGGQIGIEALVAHPPALLVTETVPAFPSLATALLAHPALAGIKRLTIEPALLACPGPWSAEAVVALTR
jgi:iron complex transport system substrate-binding protein